MCSSTVSKEAFGLLERLNEFFLPQNPHVNIDLVLKIAKLQEKFLAAQSATIATLGEEISCFKDLRSVADQTKEITSTEEIKKCRQHWQVKDFRRVVDQTKEKKRNQDLQEESIMMDTVKGMKCVNSCRRIANLHQRVNEVLPPTELPTTDFLKSQQSEIVNFLRQVRQECNLFEKDFSEDEENLSEDSIQKIQPKESTPNALKVKINQKKQLLLNLDKAITNAEQRKEKSSSHKNTTLVREAQVIKAERVRLEAEFGLHNAIETKGLKSQIQATQVLEQAEQVLEQAKQLLSEAKQAKPVHEQVASRSLSYWQAMHYESEVDKMIGELKRQSSLQSTEEQCSENTSRDTKKASWMNRLMLCLLRVIAAIARMVGNPFSKE